MWNTLQRCPFVILISESKPKTCHPEKEEAEDKDWSKLGALLLQVEISNYGNPKLQSDVSMGPSFAVLYCANTAQ